MLEMIEKDMCTGCTACFNICPKGAIKMLEDNNGFKYPQIDKEKCINCGMCKNVCPILKYKNNVSLNECYVGYNKDDEEKLKASSGAIFSLIASYVLENNGIVIGAAFNENNKLKHIAVKSTKDLEKLKGSKYLQSDLDNVFSYIKENIKNNKILFVGTPCQVAGLKSFLKKNYENLICIDLICHGVPSPKLFEKYVEELEQENGKLINYNFRDNSTGWDSYSNTAIFKDKKISNLSRDNNYMKLFLSDVALRESCYNCNFKLGNKYSDITLGDFWGVKQHYPEMYNKLGVSALIINTHKGVELFNIIRKNLIYKKCDLEKIVAGNKSLIKSPTINKKRNKVFKDLDKIPIDKLTKKYTKRPLYRRVLEKLKGLIRR